MDENLKLLCGAWNFGVLWSTGIITSTRLGDVRTGTFTFYEDMKIEITINQDHGILQVSGVFDPDALTISGTYKNFAYAWIAQEDDPYAKSLDGEFNAYKRDNQ
jgi:hypothetical protein